MTSVLKEKIIERMEAKNYSIAELERRAGLSIHSVRNILKGRIKKPSAQSLQAIAEALECSIVDLLNNAPSLREGVIQPTFHGKRKSPKFHHANLMLQCVETTTKLLADRKCTVSLDEYLDVVKKVYIYSSKEEPVKVDERFSEWLIETQFEECRRSTKG